MRKFNKDKNTVKVLQFGIFLQDFRLKKRGMNKNKNTATWYLYETEVNRNWSSL